MGIEQLPLAEGQLAAHESGAGLQRFSPGALADADFPEVHAPARGHVVGDAGELALRVEFGAVAHLGMGVPPVVEKRQQGALVLDDGLVLEKPSRTRAQRADEVLFQRPVRLLHRHPHIFELPAPAAFDPQPDVQAVILVEEVLLAGDVDVEVPAPAVQVLQFGEIVAEIAAPERLPCARPHGGAQEGIAERFLLRVHEADTLHLDILAVEVAQVDLLHRGVGGKGAKQGKGDGEGAERHQNCFFTPRPTP